MAWMKQRHTYDETVISEPGRFLVSQSGSIKTTVLLSTERVFRQQNVRWTYLDIGKFNGLYEATDVKLHVTLQRQTASPEIPMLLAGPSCDSDDILSLADNLHHLPGDITEGDTLIFGEVGAYSTSYASIAFNGIPPLKEYFI
jgi:ornithine decarboxylase